MKSAQDWRDEYYFKRGRLIAPCTMLDDILTDMEALEASIRFLQDRLLAYDLGLTPADVAID